MTRAQAEALVLGMDRLFERLFALDDMATMQAYGEYADLILDSHDGAKLEEQKSAARARFVELLCAGADVETRVALVETDTEWRLELFRVEAAVGERFKVQVSSPDGQPVFIRSMAKSIAECFEGVRTYFRGQRLEHTAVALVAMCEAELQP